MKSGIVIDGRYELTELLGIGASGEVWAARQRSVDRIVAVKLLKEFDDDRLARRFVTEARAIAMLNHPNIVTLFDHGFDAGAGTHFMVIEHVEGQLLADAMFQPMSTDERVQIVADIAKALRHAHEHGVLHRDLKPENVILSHDSGRPQVKVLDFGLARVFGLDEPALPIVGLDAESTTGRITLAGEVQGTPAYMSPEQARGELDVTPASDVYGLGVMLYELLHGNLPFESKDPWLLIKMHIQDEPQISPKIPMVLADMLRFMMAKAPDERPGAGEVAEMLQAYVALRGAAGAPPLSDVTEGSIVYGAGFVLEETDVIEPDSRTWWVAAGVLFIFLAAGWAMIRFAGRVEVRRGDAEVRVEERVVVKEVPVEVPIDVPTEVPIEVPGEATAEISVGGSTAPDADGEQEAEPKTETPVDAKKRARTIRSRRKKNKRIKREAKDFETINLKL